MFKRVLTTYKPQKTKTELRKYFNTIEGKNYTKITQITKYFGFDNADDTYDYLLTELNKDIKTNQKANKYFNNLIINSRIETVPIPNQISQLFQISSHNIQLVDTNYAGVAVTRTDNKFKIYKDRSRNIDNNPYIHLGDRPFKTFKKLAKRIYDNLMAHRGQYNRIFITERATGNVVDSRLMNNFTFQEFLELIALGVQSDSGLDLGDLIFTIQVRNLPYGGKMTPQIEVPEFLKKRGISLIVNDDDCCGQRCLVLSECKTNDELTDMKKEKSISRFANKVKKMCEKIKITGKMSFVDFEKYSEITHRQVIILSGLFVEMYSTSTEYTDKIYIYHDSKINHYHFINDINSATNDSKRHNKWCHHCRKSVRRENFDKHTCVETKCGCCAKVFETLALKNKHFNDAKNMKSWKQCEICNLWCAGSDCLDDHMAKHKNGESDVKKCNDCKKWVKSDHFEEHSCGEKFCQNCDIYHNGVHRCYIKPITNNYLIDEEGNRVYIKWCQDIYAYDFESKFDKENNHIVNLAIVKKLFSEERYEFENIEDFVKFAIKKKNATFVAHNGKAYDNWMVHKYIIKHTAHRPDKLILAGNKIMYMKIKSVRFIDSLNHIAQSLATFPDTFGITEMKKGFFPYLFNTDDNANYIGEIPDIKYFTPETMSSKKYNEFMEWYPKQTGIYDFKKELIEYCDSDVDILKKSLEIYITDSISVNGLNPLSCSTIASYCMKVYRTNYMPTDKIAIMKKDEYDFCKRGFFGGRTEVFKLFKSWTEEEIKSGTHGKYVDIQSLYPSVQYFDELPCGIPVWVDGVENDLELFVKNNYGYIECDVECPDIHIPLLPEKKNNKLMFDNVKKIKAVYSSIELNRAIEIGYKITKIYKALTFNKCDDLFKGYIQNFLKIKTECAGYKGDDIDAYIERYYKGCGVLLDKNKIKKNSGMKLLAKICLNSLWGKFGQRDDLPSNEYVKNDKWFKLLKKHIDGDIELKNEVLIDSETLYVSYVNKVEKETSLQGTNLALAGFTTANARLRLYKELYKLDKRVIYCDTDSIIYEYQKDNYNVVEGDSLGEWELEDNGDLKEVYALAPKTYGYKSIDGEEKYKCKGVTLNYGNCMKFTYDNLKKLIKGEMKDNKIITENLDFIKDNKTGKIHTKISEKETNYNPEEFKRIFFENGESRPFQ